MAVQVRQSCVWLSKLVIQFRACNSASLQTGSTLLHSRSVSTTNTLRLKEIRETKDQNVITVEGVKIESERKPYMIPKINEGCNLCRLNLDLKYTDVLILSQFLREDGCILPRSVTGICSKQQKNLKVLIRQAQRAGLMPQFRPALPDGRIRTSPQSTFKWRRYKVYFE